MIIYDTSVHNHPLFYFLQCYRREQTGSLSHHMETSSLNHIRLGSKGEIHFNTFSH